MAKSEQVSLNDGIDGYRVACPTCEDRRAEYVNRIEAIAAWIEVALAEIGYTKQRTCRYIGDEISGGCSECHGWLDPACSYCPSCGRKVVE